MLMNIENPLKSLGINNDTSKPVKFSFSTLKIFKGKYLNFSSDKKKEPYVRKKSDKIVS